MKESFDKKAALRVIIVISVSSRSHSDINSWTFAMMRLHFLATAKLSNDLVDLITDLLVGP